MSASEQPLVYVLTPVYNGEKYLAEGIESILGQSYQNWEYCILNNCSTDRSRDIAHAYAKRDKRVRVLDTPEFFNHLANQNYGFRQMPARSMYCKVLHADDWLFPECLAKMVEVGESNPKVVVMGAYGLRQDHVAWDGVPYTTSVIDGREVCRQTLLGGPYLFGSPTSLLIRADQIRQRPDFYNEANPHADKEVCFDILRDGDFGFVHQVLTFTREHSEADPSRTKSLHTHQLGDLTILMKYGRAFLNEEELEDCIERCWTSYYTLLGRMVFRDKSPHFWAHHRTAITNLGCTLSWPRVVTTIGKDILDVVLNPLKTSMRIVNNLRGPRKQFRRAGNERTGRRERTVPAE